MADGDTNPRTLSTHGVNVVVSGKSQPDAPTVVFSNSLGSTWSMWDRQLAAFEDRFRVVRYDIRGHGASEVPTGPYSIDDLADDVVAILDELGLQRVHFVGLSLGGMTGMRLAARHPERVDRLVALCTAAHLGPASAWQERAALVRSSGAQAVAEAVVTRWYTEPHRTASPQVVATAEATVTATPAEGYAGCCEAIAEMDLRADLASIVAPTLAIAGADDPATPPEFLAEIADGVQDGTLLVIEGAAHLANDEQPDAVTDAILEFLT